MPTRPEHRQPVIGPGAIGKLTEPGPGMPGTGPFRRAGGIEVQVP